MTKIEQKKFIIKQVKNWAGGEEEAEAWYKNTHIPALGSSAEQAVEAGYFERLNEYLEMIGEGGFA